MPFDTRVTVRIEQDDNSFVDIPLWADERKSSEDDFADAATIRSVSVRRFVIRYNQTIARAPVQQVYVVDANGRTWNADLVDLSDDRKRFITIRGLSENTAAAVVPDTPVDPGGGGGGGGGDDPDWNLRPGRHRPGRNQAIRFHGQPGNHSRFL